MTSARVRHEMGFYVEDTLDVDAVDINVFAFYDVVIGDNDVITCAST